MAILPCVILLVALAAPLNGMMMPVQMFKTCVSTVKVDCPCGKSGNSVTVKVEECLVVDASVHPGVVSHCQPCSMKESSFDPCESFATCQKCDSIGLGCVACPAGLTGKFCDKLEDDYYGELYPGQYAPAPAASAGNGNEIDDMEYNPMPIGQGMQGDHQRRYKKKRALKYPIEIVIPPGGGSGVNARFARSKSACAFPDYLDTAEVRCAIWPTYSKCNMSCIWGYTLRNGETSMSSKCRNKENVWKPEAFKECDPYVDCSVDLVSPGAMNCVSNRVSDPNECEIECDEYDDIPESSKKSYACTLNGSFDPPLPFCAVKANRTSTVKPPK